MKIAQATPVNDKAKMKVIIVWAWWRMSTAENVERKQRTERDIRDCGRIEEGSGHYWDTLSVAGSTGQWGLQRQMWKERSLLLCWPWRNTKQRCANRVITLALKISWSRERVHIKPQLCGLFQNTYSMRRCRRKDCMVWMNLYSTV